MKHRLVKAEPAPWWAGMSEAEYNRDEGVRTWRARTALAAVAAIIVLIVGALFNAGFANAATSPQGLPAAALTSEPETIYPGGDPGAELSAALQQITPLLGSLGSLGSSNPETPIEPPQGDLPLLDDPASVTTFCHNEQATLQIAGIAPLDGKYVITYSPSVDLTFTLLDRVLVKGEKIWLTEPVPEGTTVVVALQLPAEPDDGAAAFSGTLTVPTPICR
jgi:hypothetical protein